MSEITIQQIDSQVTENHEVAKGIFRLTLSVQNFPGNVVPGQFVMLLTSDEMDPLLRRAFSIHDYLNGEIQVLYKVVGSGTEWMSSRSQGDSVSLVGPLGKGFEIPETIKEAWIVAGGIGFAPFQFFLKKLRQQHVTTRLFYGARTSHELVGADEHKRDLDLILATDDGSRGERGRIVDIFEQKIKNLGPKPSGQVFACGPHPMLAQLAECCRRLKIPCQVSLETQMACGLGTCMGCVIQTPQGYQRVCREGPVFSIGNIIWGVD